MTASGINVRPYDIDLMVRVSLKDSDGAKVTTGTTELRIYEIQDNGTLNVFDWTTNDFVAPGAGTPDDETTMTHQQRRDSTGADVDTGIWTKALATLTNFVEGAVYILQITNTNAFPESQEREIQIGFHEIFGDITANLDGDVQGNVDGTVASVTGAVGSVTGAVGSVTGNIGGSVQSVLDTVSANVIQLTTSSQRATDLAEIARYFIANSAEPLTSYVADDSLYAKMLAIDGDISDYDDNTDSQEAIRDRGDSAWITATSVTVSDKTGFKLASDGLDLQTTWTVDITGTIDTVTDVTNRVTANIDRINDSNSDAVKLGQGASTVIEGTVKTDIFAPTTTQFEADLSVIAPVTVEDLLVNRIIIFKSGSQIFEATQISAHSVVGSHIRFTVTAMTAAPSVNDTFMVV